MEVFIIGCMSVSDGGDMIEAFMVEGGVGDEVSCWPQYSKLLYFAHNNTRDCGSSCNPFRSHRLVYNLLPEESLLQ